MGNIAFTLPDSIEWSPASEITVADNRTTVYMSSGKTRSRSTGRISPRRYLIRPNLHTDAEVFEFQTMIRKAAAWSDPHLWIPEPFEAIHENVICSPLADGSRTTFQIGVIDASDVVVFQNGVPLESGDYTLHSMANEVEFDGHADGTWILAGDWTTRTLLEGFGGVSNVCNQVYCGSGAGTSRIGWYPVTAGETITSISIMMPRNDLGDDYAPLAIWGDATPAYHSQSIGTNQNPEPGSWSVLSESFVVPSGASNVIVGCKRTTTTGTAYYYHCGTSFAAGDFSTWHLPSLSPSLIEFSSAPAAGTAITVTATGRRVTRCSVNFDAMGYTVAEGGNRITEIEAVEAPEV